MACTCQNTPTPALLCLEDPWRSHGQPTLMCSPLLGQESSPGFHQSINFTGWRMLWTTVSYLPCSDWHKADNQCCFLNSFAAVYFPMDERWQASTQLGWGRSSHRFLSNVSCTSFLPRQAVLGFSLTSGFLPTTLHPSCSEESPTSMAVITSKLPCWRSFLKASLSVMRLKHDRVSHWHGCLHVIDKVLCLAPLTVRTQGSSQRIYPESLEIFLLAP